MKIFVDALFLRPGWNGGTQTYVVEMLRELCGMQGARVTVICYEDTAALFQGFACSIRTLQRIGLLGSFGRVWHQVNYIALLAESEGADILFCPGYLGPIVHSVPVVITIHDAQYADVPYTLAFPQRLCYNVLLPLMAVASTAVLTVSEFSRGRIVKHLDIPERKVKVVLEAAGSRYALSAEAGGNPISHDKYILAVCSGYPHKNLKRLVEAYRKLRALKLGCPRLKLVGGHVPAWLREAGDLDGVEVLGYVSEDRLAELYQNAFVFVMPSLYEGFGIPVLEAMGCGVPVACSRAASLPEVAGDAAVYFTPEDVDDIVAALAALIDDEALRRQCIERGYVNVSRFSWKCCAAETLEFFEKVACDGVGRRMV